MDFHGKVSKYLFTLDFIWKQTKEMISLKSSLMNKRVLLQLLIEACTNYEQLEE